MTNRDRRDWRIIFRFGIVSAVISALFDISMADEDHLDNDPLSRVRTVPLYRERYVLITRSSARVAGLKSISWAMAATLPLCLLTPSMQNRRILDMQFRAAGATVNAVIETNSMVTLWSHIRFGNWSDVNDPARAAKVLGRTPMNRFGDPEDIGWAATYLCSPAAKFVTGAVLPVDGGASIGF